MSLRRKRFHELDSNEMSTVEVAGFPVFRQQQQEEPEPQSELLTEGNEAYPKQPQTSPTRNLPLWDEDAGFGSECGGG